MKYCARIGYLSLRIAIPKKTRIWVTMNLSGRLTAYPSIGKFINCVPCCARVNHIVSNSSQLNPTFRIAFLATCAYLSTIYGGVSQD
jgi:hypothetical protein